MLKIFKKLDRLHLVLALVVAMFLFVAAVPDGITRLTSLIVGSASDTPTVTPGDDDVYIKGTLEVDGVFYADGGGIFQNDSIGPYEIADVVRYINLPLQGFTAYTEASVAAVAYTPLSVSTVPGWEAGASIPQIVWADGEASAIAITFRIPGIYSSGGAFKIAAHQSNVTTAAEIDFDVYVYTIGSASLATVTNQVPVALTYADTTPSEVTLTPGTDFTSLASGNWVTFRFWRDDVHEGTGELHVSGAEFYYTATQ